MHHRMPTFDYQSTAYVLPRFHRRLSDEQLEALRVCAKGISLRFEKPEIVRALLAAGFVARSVAGMVSITPKGAKYLDEHGG